MSRESNSGDARDSSKVTIPFGQKYTESEKFSVVFREGMALVEATAAYLDGEGRREAKALSASASLAYATESMRLTTRLMQLASWLLIRRAVNEGEMTPEQAMEEHNKVKLQPPPSAPASKDYDALPERLRELNEASLKLHRRIVRLDELLQAEVREAAPPNENPVEDHIARLKAAFGGGENAQAPEKGGGDAG